MARAAADAKELEINEKLANLTCALLHAVHPPAVLTLSLLSFHIPTDSIFQLVEEEPEERQELTN
ncbi:hypothetical protein [Pikeienuella sp. HZG-20]|uniref:hypothetical protein n=1 Tax=Paludibacillus litoralis TaxID=3133267 RepID=UPI0030ED15AD